MSQPQHDHQSSAQLVVDQAGSEKAPLEQKWQQLPIFSSCVWDRHPQESISVNKIASHEAVTPSIPQFGWKQSINSKGKQSSSKSIMSSIHNKFSMMKRANPEISNLMKKITNQIKTQLLVGKKSTIQSPKDITQIPDCLQNSIPAKEEFHIRSEILPDRQIVKESCYRRLLKPTQIDNDIQSDDEDLNMGIRYMYGELLYSVGNEMVSQREQKQVNKKTKFIHKILKKQEHDKQNVNHNVISAKGNSKNEKQNYHNSNNLLKTSSYNSVIFQR